MDDKQGYPDVWTPPYDDFGHCFNAIPFLTFVLVGNSASAEFVFDLFNGNVRTLKMKADYAINISHSSMILPLNYN